MHDVHITSEPVSEDRLRRYLPQHLWISLDSDDIAPVTQHLRNVLRVVLTSVPQHIVNPLMADPTAQGSSGAFTLATIMFADISGFTAMSEQLTQLGREGAEVITEIVNDYFATMLKIAVVGDIYSINENYINNKIFDRLCDLSVYPEKSTPFSILITNKFGFGIEDPLMKQKVKSYLKHNIGSFAQHTIKKVIKNKV